MPDFVYGKSCSCSYSIEGVLSTLWVDTVTILSNVGQFEGIEFLTSCTWSSADDADGIVQSPTKR